MENLNQQAKQKEPRRVGVLLVHGIGEQRQFEHLESEARNIISSLQEMAKENQNLTVRVTVNSKTEGVFGSSQEIWSAWEPAPLMVEVIETKDNNQDREVTQIHFHQVWWSDLDEPSSLLTQLRFWLWGLSLWTIKGKFDSISFGEKERMEAPKTVKDNQQNTYISLFQRVRLFWVSLVILLILPTLALLNLVLRRLLGIEILPRPDILAQYIGDVKLFQQQARVSKGPLADLGLPPRVTIERRMIRALVRMALAKYDRWYILAHSQGTVLAFNGIMKTAQSLPNYLSEELWDKAKAENLVRPVRGNEAISQEEKETMLPPFPSWRDEEYILDRKFLFAKLRGLLTYGSPLSKFAALWPEIVLLNKEKDVFNKNFQWFNVYDPTDPVAGPTKSFCQGLSDRELAQILNVNKSQLYSWRTNKTSATARKTDNQLTAKLAEWQIRGDLWYKLSAATDKSSSSRDALATPIEPIDTAYRADCFHLISHTKYLTYNQGNNNRLVNKVADWLLTGQKWSINEKEENSGWPGPRLTQVYIIVRQAVWVLLALLFSCLLGELIFAVFLPELSLLKALTDHGVGLFPSWLLTILVTGSSYILLAAIVVLIAGGLVKGLVGDLRKL